MRRVPGTRDGNKNNLSQPPGRETTCIDLMAIYERTCSSARTFFSSMTGRLAGKQQFRAFLNRELARVQETICFFLRKEPA